MKDRIKELIENEKITSKEFAGIIEIQQSAVSHLLAGRNKPSMDVIQRILINFKHINPSWLLLGEGNMYKTSNKAFQGRLFDEPSSNVENIEPTIAQNNENTNKNNSQIDVNQVNKTVVAEKKILKIIVYFSDNTYEEFNHEK